jgi:hypothetical protein
MMLRIGTGVITIVAPGLATDIPAAGTALADIETEGGKMTNCAGLRLWAGSEDEKAPIAANTQANIRNPLMKLALRDAIMNQGYSVATDMPTHRRASFRTGPKFDPTFCEWKPSILWISSSRYANI